MKATDIQAEIEYYEYLFNRDKISEAEYLFKIKALILAKLENDEPDDEVPE